MILNKGECVICSTQEELSVVWNMLREHGYRWWYNEPLAESLVTRSLAIRWCAQNTFPNCLALTHDERVQQLLEYGVIEDADGVYEFAAVDFVDFMQRANGCQVVSVDDLL